MARGPTINFDRLIRDILLDIALLKWFATHARRPEVEIAIETQRRGANEDDATVLHFLQQHVGGGDQTQNREG